MSDETQISLGFDEYKGLLRNLDSLKSSLAAEREKNGKLREVIVRCAIPLEALKIVPDGLGDEVRTAIEDAVAEIRSALASTSNEPTKEPK